MNVFVGMSGGVDSSVSAALLKQAGHDVTGVFIRVWEPDFAKASPGRPEVIKCTWRDDRRDAMRVAAQLEIPLITIDLSEQYKKGVVDYMIREYQAGRTPNPDVMCNKQVKFGAFYDWAMAQGADYVATGHYAQTGLTMATDQTKDQTYFLWTLKPEQLAHTLFPIGHLPKTEVRQLAEKFNLPNADKKDSQGLCFIGKLDFSDFLRHFIKAESGNVLNEKGEPIGTHAGALFLTLGQRHGFTIADDKKTADDTPYYVVGKDIAANTITVAHEWRDSRSAKVSVSLSQVSFTESLEAVEEASARGALEARLRYRQPTQKCAVVSIEDRKGEKGITATVDFNEPQLATPGQSLVWYAEGKCLGGGIIE